MRGRERGSLQATVPRATFCHLEKPAHTVWISMICLLDFSKKEAGLVYKVGTYPHYVNAYFSRLFLNMNNNNKIEVV